MPARRPPVRINASGEAGNGRGLILAEAISEQWGWYGRDDGDGKFAWAVIRAELEPGTAAMGHQLEFSRGREPRGACQRVPAGQEEPDSHQRGNHLFPVRGVTCPAQPCQAPGHRR